MFKVGDRVVSKLGKEFWDILGKHGVICRIKDVNRPYIPYFCIIQFDNREGISSSYHPEHLMAEDKFVYIDDFGEKIRDRLG